MDNITPLELVWTVWGSIGWILSVLVLGASLSRLIGRYQDKRNGPVRLLAWQFVITSALCTTGLTAVLAVGVLAMFLPSRAADLDQPWEISAARVSGWLLPTSLFIIATAFVGIAVVKLYIGWRLARYYEAESHYDETYHPRRRKEDLLLKQEAGIPSDKEPQ